MADCHECHGSRCSALRRAGQRATATAVDAARHALGRQLELKVCGLHFDDRHRLDPARSVRPGPARHALPAGGVGVAEEGSLSRATVDSIDVAARVPGAAAGADLRRRCRDSGDEATHARLPTLRPALLAGRARQPSAPGAT